MGSLPAWARRKILDGFVRRWTRHQIEASGSFIRGTKANRGATRNLTTGKLPKCQEEDPASTAEQRVLLQMDGVKKRADAWRKLLSDIQDRAGSDALPAQAVAYVHFAAAEEYLHQGDSVSALVTTAEAPPGPHIFGGLEGSVSWPQVHYVRALAKLISGEPAEAGKLIQLAMDEALRILPIKDVKYLKDLKTLRVRMASAAGGEADTTTDEAEDLKGKLVLFVGRSKTGATGYWQLGSKRSEARLNPIEILTAKAFVTHLTTALSKRTDITVSKAKLDKAVLDRLKEKRHESHLRKTRCCVLEVLKELTGTDVATIRMGSRGGMVFHGEFLHGAGIVEVRAEKL